MKALVVGDTEVQPGSKCYELLTSKLPEDQKKGKRLLEYTRKAAAVGYELSAVEKLRKEFKDVL